MREQFKKVQYSYHNREQYTIENYCSGALDKSTYIEIVPNNGLQFKKTGAYSTSTYKLNTKTHSDSLQVTCQ